MGRYKIYEAYKEYERKKDTSSMEELCNKPNNAFELQVQQLFLRDYMSQNPNVKRLLLYHAIGSGKSCSAIVIAEAFLSLNPAHHVTFILPARLRTNMYDELFTPCSGFKYVSQEDYEKYMDPATTKTMKARIKTKFMANVKENYTILSFEKFRKDMDVHKRDIKNHLKQFSKNNMIIVDEAHNLFTADYDKTAYKEIESSGVIKKPVKGMNAIYMKLLSKFCNKDTKMVFMTATPIFDNIEQFRELLKIINPKATLPLSLKISDVAKQLRGMVSYFPGTSKNAYPTSEYKIHDIKISSSQDELIGTDIFMDDDPMHIKDAFMSKQRRFSLSISPYDEITNYGDLKEISPKIDFLIDFINKNVGKHVVYSNFIEYGVKVVENALKYHGWKNLNEVKNSPELWDQYRNKVFAIWDGNTHDGDKQFIKSVSNNPDNLFGNKVRVIIGSPSIREGVTVKHAQHIHILDPLWNMSAKVQVEGRAIRFCSHSDIDEKRDKPLKRHVNIHIYNLVPIPNGIVPITADQIIANIMIRKQEAIEIGENALKKVAIDYHLFKKMYSDKEYNSSPTNPGSAESNISFDKDGFVVNKKQKNANRNSCPSKRRPDAEGNCKPDHYVKLNPQGHECCYKYTKKEREERQRNPQYNTPP